MANVIFTLFTGIFVLIAVKICNVCYKYLKLCRRLRKLPVTTQPAHWASGNLNQIKDSASYIDVVVRETNEANKRILLLWFGPFPSISVTHPDTFKQLIKQVSLKARGPMDGYRFLEPWLGDGLLISGGKKWERNRKLLTPAFHFDILNGYVLVMNKTADILLTRLEAASMNDSIVDVFPYVCKASLDTMLKCSLSYNGDIQDESESDYIKTVKRLSEINWQRSLQLILLPDTIFNLSPLGREFYRLCEEAHKFTGNIIQARKQKIENEESRPESKRRLDFLDILLTARDEYGQGLSAQEIQDEVDTFTFEGHDTTSSAISWTMYALARYPDLQEKVFNDVQSVLQGSQSVTSDHLGRFSYLPIFLKEVLRYFSPVPIIGRRHTDKPITIDGIEIPVGVTVWIQIYAIHHNKDVWPNHEIFDPERFRSDRRDDNDIYGFIPFSAGSRNCIGQVFAMNEIKITIAKFVSRFEAVLVAEQEPILIPDLVMRAENGINIRLRKRNIAKES